MPDTQLISVDQLRIGLYIQLDLPWFKHPFAFNRFRIKSADQIETLRGLGLTEVRYSPALSAPIASEETPPGATAGNLAAPAPGGDEKAMAAAVADETAAAPVAGLNSCLNQALAAKRAMIEKIRQQREAAAGIENAFVSSARMVRDIEKSLLERPAESIKQAGQLIGRIVDAILCAPELAIHVMGNQTDSEELYFHSLNVTTLALMVAREIHLPTEVVGAMGMGALLHDIGRQEIPDRILLKTEPLTAAERHLYEMHCQYGVAMGQRLHLPAAVIRIIQEHHELFDGSGYPQKLKGEAIGMLSRIVAIANHYDDLCNPPNLADALTPHEALSMMFARQRSKFDPKLLQIFVRCLGVYPPGTIVQLSNGLLGMVATVNTGRPLRPMIVIHDASVPKDEAILVDMEQESDLSISKAIRPAQVPPDILAYLSPRKRVSYYFDPLTASQESPRP